ncbi:putative major facilitator superfamily, MFS transporter superfamily [Septoria linicola]|nr:putative major facilitator superfamily, MFS transporter superfamily [Septoria linicola]
MDHGENTPARVQVDQSPARFIPGDLDNPRSWSSLRKWTIVASIGLVDLTVSFGASGFSPASSDFARHFGISHEVSHLGLSLYVLGLAFGPMLIAPLSEYYGRTALYLIPYGIFLVFLALTALVDNLPGFFILRLLSGTFASVTIANFGGTIADLFSRDEVGPAMNIFLWAAVCGSPMGYFILALVAEHHGWRTVFWTLLGICGLLWAQLVVVLVPFGNETRHSVLLRRRARRQGTTIPDDAQARSLKTLFTVTLARPFRLLSTETIVIFGALYNGFLYGLSFMFNGAFGLVFGEQGYGFTTQGVGLCFLGLVIGISLGPVAGVWQERYYQRQIHNGRKCSADSVDSEASALLESSQSKAPKYMPEARVQLGKLAAILLPISLGWFAWTSPAEYGIHWIVPVLATALFGFSFFTLIFMVAIYTEESYMVYSASALAGIALARNIVGAVFPMIGNIMFERLGTNWAGTIVAGLALLLAPIPFILERYGPKLRAKSPFACEHVEDED